ncbi:tRNA-dihydrouridine(20a/20b) synthase [NAD(P)+]-like isoform X2 [Manduca sexta]|nr:tRNA-dihydrouridine(20a/20b) synthase [NAD(P)+]-like isoform X2 [Manduca sexta]XP_037299098.1 tRNA-dihydrouridine(20a/20b) synthase [NAD(P)+]-like isoform X2 [Manduca sexta]KAG6451819.1 hypothetical protein O3G_MSEX007370 [Manduca sexta]
MVMADSFCQNSKARDCEFLTTTNDTPLIVQFAANNRNDFVDATKLVCPYVDGVDLNCGCPQKWAMKDGYGCSLLSKPEIIYDLVKGIRNNLPSNFSVSVKIRILKELKKTITMCQQMEKCGVNFLTVHGRNPSQKSTGMVDTLALKHVCESIKIPMVANGGVKTLLEADKMHEEVQCDGVMAASGLLTNPALFSGANRTPLSCIKQWMDMKDLSKNNITFQCYHHHLVFMLEKVLTREQKQVFNHLGTFESVDNYLQNNLLQIDEIFSPKLNLEEFISCEFPDEILLKHSSKCRGCGKSTHYCICEVYSSNETDGNYFTSCVNTYDDLDHMNWNLFDEPV